MGASQSAKAFAFLRSSSRPRGAGAFEKRLVSIISEHFDGAWLFARRLGVSRRTLSGWAARTGSRGVRPLMSKCRVLVALELLRNSERSIEQVAHTLRFSSSAHLHNTIHRYTGSSPRTAAKHDIEAWCHALLARDRSDAGRVTNGIPVAATIVPRAEWSTAPNDTTLQPRNLTP